MPADRPRTASKRCVITQLYYSCSITHLVPLTPPLYASPGRAPWRQFRVRWKGCNWEEDTWEPRDVISEEHIAQFELMEAAQKRAIKTETKSASRKRGSSFVRF